MISTNKTMGNPKIYLQVSLSYSSCYEAPVFGRMVALKAASKDPMLDVNGKIGDKAPYHLKGTNSSIILLVAVAPIPVDNP